MMRKINEYPKALSYQFYEINAREAAYLALIDSPFRLLELELGKIFGRHVDLRTPKDLSRYFHDEVIT